MEEIIKMVPMMVVITAARLTTHGVSVWYLLVLSQAEMFLLVSVTTSNCME